MLAEAQILVERLQASQNPDGGWAYNRGSSWVEPTAFVVLALQSQSNAPVARSVRRGAEWLVSQQKPSGGWAPTPAVAECTSVTSIAALALLTISTLNPSIALTLDSAVNWTASQVYPDDLSWDLLLAKALHLPPAHAPGSVAWYPGTAGWVTPTSLAALVLFSAARQQNRPELQYVARRCCEYLLTRRCVDEGWNHGGSKTRSEDATSYPETTGLALLALRVASINPPRSSLALARRFATHPESIEGLSWIQMALCAPGNPIPDPTPLPSPRTSRDCALRLLALAAQQGHNTFLGDQV